MGRGTTQEVELVEDDDRDGGTPPPSPDDPAEVASGDPGRRGWSRRRRLAVGAGLLAVLVAAAGVAQLGVTARERARLAAVAALPDVLPRLEGPPQVLWTDDDGFAPAARTAGGLLVGTVGGDGLRVRAVEAATGTVVWEVELLAATDRVEAADGSVARHASGYCWSDGRDADVVLCAADDATTLFDEGERTDLPATVHRVLLLDARDGSVVTDLSDTAPTFSARSFAVHGDLVLVSGLEDGRAQLAALRRDGTVAWRRSVPATPGPEAAVVGALPLGDGVAFWTSTRLHVLGALGTTLRTVELDGEGWVDRVAPDTVVAITGAWSGNGTSTVVRPDGPVTYDGRWVRLTVDDGSAPLAALTARTGEVHAYARDGTRLWSASAPEARQAVVLDGRVHLATSVGVVTLDARTGAELWRTSSLWPDTPVLTDGEHLLVVAGPERVEDGGLFLVGLDRADGSELWRSTTALDVDHVETWAGMLLGYRWESADDSGRPVLSILG